MKTLSLQIPRSGSAMVAVFWLMSVLGLVVFTTVRVVSHDVDVVASTTHGVRAKHLAEMGIAVGSHSRVEPSDPILSQRFDDGFEGFDVRITSEGRLFNINALIRRESGREILKRIFTDWGMEFIDAEALVDAMIDWVDANDVEQLQGAESEYYLDRGFPDYPYNRYFFNLDEVRLVRGMAELEALQPAWQSWFTVFNSGKLDLNEADADLIAVVADVTGEQADQLVEHVLGPDGIRYTEDDQRFQTINEPLSMLGISTDEAEVRNNVGVNDPVVRIESTGFATGAKRKITLVLRNRTGQPAILQRMEEIVP